MPSLYDRHGNGLLETATLTVAQMAAYNQFGGDRFRMKSYQNYGRTLKILQEIIQSEEQAVDDKVITAILLLCTFKVSLFPFNHQKEKKKKREKKNRNKIKPNRYTDCAVGPEWGERW